MQEVEDIVRSQTESVEETRMKFDSIADAINVMQSEFDDFKRIGDQMVGQRNNMLELMQALSAVSEETAAGTEESSASVLEQVDSVGEITSASDELVDLAYELKVSLDKFRIKKTV